MPGWFVRFIYLQQSDGRRKELEVDQDIFVPAVTDLADGACNVTAWTFWYGAKDLMLGDPAEIIRQNRAECR